MSKFDAGTMIWTDMDAAAPSLSIASVACVHCGGHFPHPRFDATAGAKESRVGRGFCKNCNGFICGKGCMECVNVEQLIENIEKGRELDFKPIVSKPYQRDPSGGQIWMPPLPTSATE